MPSSGANAKRWLSNGALIRGGRMVALGMQALDMSKAGNKKGPCVGAQGPRVSARKSMHEQRDQDDHWDRDAEEKQQ